LREPSPVYRLGTISVPAVRAREVDEALAFLREETKKSISAIICDAIVAYARALGWQGVPEGAHLPAER
jgi:hypothetical protein